MQVSTETFGNVLVAHTPDELTEDTMSPFLDALSGPVEAGQTQLVLQMDRSEAYDSVALTALLDFRDELKSQNGNLKLSGLGDPGKKIFELTRLDKRFEMFDSVIDAVASFGA